MSAHLFTPSLHPSPHGCPQSGRPEYQTIALYRRGGRLFKIIGICFLLFKSQDLHRLYNMAFEREECRSKGYEHLIIFTERQRSSTGSQLEIIYWPNKPRREERGKGIIDRAENLKRSHSHSYPEQVDKLSQSHEGTPCPPKCFWPYRASDLRPQRDLLLID